MYGGGRYGGGHGGGFGGRGGYGGGYGRRDIPDRDDSSNSEKDSDNDTNHYSGSDDQSTDGGMSYGGGGREGSQGRGMAGRPPPRAPPGMMDRGNRQAEPGAGDHLRYTGSVLELPQELQQPYREDVLITMAYESGRIDEDEVHRRFSDLYERNGWPAPALFDMETLCPPDWVRARRERERLLGFQPRSAPGGGGGGRGGRLHSPSGGLDTGGRPRGDPPRAPGGMRGGRDGGDPSRRPGNQPPRRR